MSPIFLKVRVLLQYKIKFIRQNKIPICLFQANERVDSGRIFFKKEFFNVKETSLYNQIRNDQGNATMKIIKKFLKEYPNIKSKKQTGKSTF